MDEAEVDLVEEEIFEGIKSGGLEDHLFCFKGRFCFKSGKVEKGYPDLVLAFIRPKKELDLPELCPGGEDKFVAFFKMEIEVPAFFGNDPFSDRKKGESEGLLRRITDRLGGGKRAPGIQHPEEKTREKSGEGKEKRNSPAELGLFSRNTISQDEKKKR